MLRGVATARVSLLQADADLTRCLRAGQWRAFGSKLASLLELNELAVCRCDTADKKAEGGLGPQLGLVDILQRFEESEVPTLMRHVSANKQKLFRFRALPAEHSH